MFEDNSNLSNVLSTGTCTISIGQTKKRGSSPSLSDPLSNGDIPAKRRIDLICDSLASAQAPNTSPNNAFSSNIAGSVSFESYSGSTTNMHDRLNGNNEECDLALSHSSMDQELKFLIRKFVRADYVIHCLELSGFDSPAVFMCLTETKIKQLEEFVSYTCSLIQSKTVRRHYLGPVFVHHPSSFRFPTGVVCGLRLALEELKRTTGTTLTGDNIIANSGGCLSISSSHARTPSSTPGASFYEQGPESTQFGLSNASIQTELSFPIPVSTATPLAKSTPDMYRQLTNNVSTSKKEDSDAQFFSQETLKSNCNSSVLDVPVFPDCCGSPDVLQITSDPDDLASDTEPLNSNVVNNSHQEDVSDCGAAPIVSNKFASQCSSICAPTMVASTTPERSVHNEFNTNISLNHLIEHSSASACRLAARQFLNARLIRGVDFDMEMELTGSEHGHKRITGIFYCHLCRERRERTCAVRFSVARNRYPVMSNVLSHLKTHFQYRTVGGQPVVIPRRSNSIGRSSPDKINSSSPPHCQTNNFILNNSLQDLVSQVMHFTSPAPSNAHKLLPPSDAKLEVDEKELVSSQNYQTLTQPSAPCVSGSSSSSNSFNRNS